MNRNSRIFFLIEAFFSYEKKAFIRKKKPFRDTSVFKKANRLDVFRNYLGISTTLRLYTYI